GRRPVPGRPPDHRRLRRLQVRARAQQQAGARAAGRGIRLGDRHVRGRDRGGIADRVLEAGGDLRAFLLPGGGERREPGTRGVSLFGWRPYPAVPWVVPVFVLVGGRGTRALGRGRTGSRDIPFVPGSRFPLLPAT